MAEDPKGGGSYLVLRCRHPDVGPLGDHLGTEIPPTVEYSTGRGRERPDSLLWAARLPRALPQYTVSFRFQADRIPGPNEPEELVRGNSCTIVRARHV